MAERNVTPNIQLTPTTVIIIAIVAIIGFSVMTSFFQVDQAEEAIVLFLGKMDRIVGPGLHFKWPFGIEKNYNIPSQRNITQEFGFRTISAEIQTRYSTEDFSVESEMLTGDKNIVDIEWIIQYEIDDPAAWLFNVEHNVFLGYDRYNRKVLKKVDNPKDMADLQNETTIRDIAQSVINQIVGDKTILGVIGTERDNIQRIAREMMNETLQGYEMGVKITEVALQNTLPPEGSVRDAFEDVNKAEQDKERIINEANEKYNKAIEEAKGKAEQMLEEADGYRSERINIARGDTDRFLAVLKEYLKAPSITRTRLYIETMENIFSNTENTDIIDKSLQNFIPFKGLTPAGGQR